MSDTRAQVVIEIAASDSTPHAPGRVRRNSGEFGLGSELRRCLQPGMEIALTFPGFTATMSVVWITERQREASFRAGVRLVRVSPRQPVTSEAVESL